MLPLLISSEQTLTKCFREILAAYGGVHLEDIRGMRAPFLAIGVPTFIFIVVYYLLFIIAIGVPTFQNLDHNR